MRAEHFNKGIVLSEEKCIHCGICCVVCPTSAFSMTRPKMVVKLDLSLCIDCEQCVKVCPYQAIDRHLHR